MKRLLCVLALLGVPVMASAQGLTFNSVSRTDTISFNGDSFEITKTTVGGAFGAVKVQTLDSYSGTWEVQCAPDGTNYSTSVELRLSLADSTSAVTAVTDEIGIWDVQNAGGCQAIKVIATAGFAASDTVVIITADAGSGGGGGGGGGAAGSSGGEYNATPPTLSDGNTDSLQLDVNGRLLTNIFPTTPAAAAYIPARLTNGTDFLSFGEDYIHDDALTIVSAGGPANICRASAAAPTAVSASDDAALAWCLLTGAQVVAGNAFEDVAETAGGALFMSGAVVRAATSTVPAGSTATASENATINVDVAGLLWTRTVDPCSGSAKSYYSFDITSATTTEITPSLGGSSNFWYICALNIVTSAANNVNLVDDNSDNCASVTASLISTGLAAGDGWNFGANGGLTIGNGMGSVMKSVTSNSVLCLVTSASAELHGTFAVVAAP